MGRLKGIPTIISPELLHVLACMGHGDEIVFADANFPTSNICRQGPREVRADGHEIPQLLAAVLQLMPLDRHVPYRAVVMAVLEDDVKKGFPATMPVWKKYCEEIKKAGDEPLLYEEERFQFYERAKKAYAVVHTGETSLYGNIILKMGVIP
ncbi:fucose mutarotase-like [Schistocerca gregaria]|uniref:fucose mutarotase-like n=1 Tax=Schistocerca gregaria TaxID=7010 RepID=UPI00211F428C|nr:fucose mutarotase-like [Schistocerca gregaria]